MERLDARNGRAAESVKRLQAAVAALEEIPPAPAIGTTDWTLYEQNRADIREIVKRLRNGSH
jgi:exonuclease VII small subunit